MDPQDRTYSLSEAANFTAESLGKRPADYVTHHGMIRNWWNKKLLPPAESDGEEGTNRARIDLKTVCAIPFLSVLADMGQDWRELEASFRALRTFADAGDGESYSGIEVLWDSVERAWESDGEPEPWFFHLWKSDKGFAGQWTHNEDDPRGPVAKRIMDDHATVTGYQVVRTVIAATPVMQALFRAINGEEAMPHTKSRGA